MTRQHFKKTFMFVLLVNVPCVSFAQAEMAAFNPRHDFETLPAVENTVLDKIRGGFIPPDGVKVDVGVSKVIWVDDALQPQRNINVENINLNGHKVSVNDMHDINAALKTIVQNNLDHKIIQNYTILDVVIKNLPVHSIQSSILESTRNIQDLKAIQDMQILR